MNNRIKELERQADEYADGLGLAGDEWCDAQSTKFAELIVRECGQVLVDKTPVVNFVEGEDWDKGYDRAMNDCIHHIYEHFGFE